MTFIHKGQPTGKPVSLEKLREEWLRCLILHPGVVKGSVMRVAVVLAYHINRKTGEAFPGVRTIRKLTGLSTSTISAALKWLEANGYMQIQRGRTRNSTNRYVPLMRVKSEHPVRPVRTPAFAPGETDLPTYLPKYLPSYNATPSGVGDKPLASEARKKEASDKKQDQDPQSTESPLSAESPKSQAYRLAHKRYGNHGAALLGQANRDGRGWPEILDYVLEADENDWTVDQLAHALWVPRP